MEERNPLPRQGTFLFVVCNLLKPPAGAGEGQSCYSAVRMESEMLFCLGPWSRLIHSLSRHPQPAARVLGTISGVGDKGMSLPSRNGLAERVVPGAVGRHGRKAAWRAVMEGAPGVCCRILAGHSEGDTKVFSRWRQTP